MTAQYSVLRKFTIQIRWEIGNTRKIHNFGIEQAWLWSGIRYAFGWSGSRSAKVWTSRWRLIQKGSLFFRVEQREKIIRGQHEWLKRSVIDKEYGESYRRHDRKFGPWRSKGTILDVFRFGKNWGIFDEPTGGIAYSWRRT